jgi:hypothetical protein
VIRFFSQLTTGALMCGARFFISSAKLPSCLLTSIDEDIIITNGLECNYSFSALIQFCSDSIVMCFDAAVLLYVL